MRNPDGEVVVVIRRIVLRNFKNFESAGVTEKRGAIKVGTKNAVG